jgi:hypothetical protein
MKLRKPKKEKISLPQNEEMVCVTSSDKKEMVCSREGEAVKVEAKEPLAETGAKRGGVWIGTMNFFAAPYRGFKENYEKRYGEAKKLFVVDLILLGVIAVLLGFNVYFFLSGVLGGKSLVSVNHPAPANTSVSGPVADSFLSTQLKINGQDSTIFTPGEDLDYTISYINSGSKDIYDVALKVNLEGAPLDFSHLSLEKGVARGGAVVWTKDQIPAFAKLAPGAKGELKFKIGTAESAAEPRVAEFGSLLKSSFEISYKLSGDFGQSYTFKSDTREDKFNSDLVLASAARYYTEEGDQLGIGHLPPAAGKTTKYWIFWSVDNNLNDVSGVSVSAALPPNVSWTGKISVSLGELNYDSVKRAVVWKVGDVLHYAGEISPKQGVAFEVALTPTADEIGSELTLLDKIKIYGKDNFTGQFLEKQGPDLTTNLIYDSLAGGKGRVVK